MPFSGSDITFSVSFSVSNDFKSGTINYTGTTDYLGGFGILLANVVETVSFFMPGNTSTPFATPAITLSSTRSVSANLPTGTDGKVIQGEYMVMVTAVVAPPTDAGTYTTPDSPSLYHKFCPGALTLSMSPDINCLCGIIGIDDNTDYVGLGWTLNSRTLTLNGPIVSGSTPIYTITSSGDRADTTGQSAVYNGGYSWNIAISATSGTTTVSLTASGSFTVDCKTFCKMKCALDKADGMLSDEPQLLNQLLLAGLHFQLAYNNQSCNPSASNDAMASFWDDLKPFGIRQEENCCDCCSDEGDIITPLCGSGGGGSNLSVSNTSPTWFTLTYVGNVLTAGPSAQAIAYMNAISTYDVDSTDGSVTVTPTTTVGSATTPPHTVFNLSVAVDPVEQLSFFYGESYFPAPVSFGIQNIVSKGDCWDAGGLAVTPDTYAGIDCLRIDGFVNPAAPYSGILNYRVGLNLEQNGNKVTVAGNGHIGQCVSATANGAPNSGSNGTFYIIFWDLMSQNPGGSWNPMPYSRLDQFLEFYKIQITIYR